jgi:hypothetical protein
VIGGFRVGDWVEVVNVKPKPGADAAMRRALRQLVLGAIHQVESVSALSTGVLLKDVVAAYQHDGWGWAAFRFRKIHRPRAEFVAELLSAPVLLPTEREDA